MFLYFRQSKMLVASHLYYIITAYITKVVLQEKDEQMGMAAILLVIYSLLSLNMTLRHKIYKHMGARFVECSLCWQIEQTDRDDSSWYFTVWSLVCDDLVSSALSTCHTDMNGPKIPFY